MIRRFRTAALATSALAVVIVAACRDGGVTAPRNDVNAITEWRANLATTCTPMTLAQLNALTDSVFSAGGPNANAVKSKIDQVDKAKKKGDKKKTDEAAFNANRLVFQKFKGPQPLAGTNAQVARLISAIFCFAGIDITISDPANSNIIDPSAATQVVTAKDSSAATKLPPGSITEPTVLEFTKVPNSFSTPGAGPLNTKLDQYPGFYLIQAGSASGSGPATPVVVAICPDASVPASVRGRLRLGHEKAGEVFEITPPADASFLVCPAPTNLSFLPNVLQKLANKLLPKTLYAAIAKEEFRGGVGGTASEFSPFDPVDPELSFRGGVGGTAGEFIRSEPTTDTTVRTPKRGRVELPKLKAAPGRAAPSQAALLASCAADEAPWSSPIATECRPGIVITTALGTVLQNVPVSWNVVLGVGSIAAEASGAQTCSAFGPTVANTTDANGRAGVCWNMGVDLGINTVTATPSVGGDAPAGVTFVPATTTFTATSIKVTPVVATSCPDSVVYNAAAQTPCTNTVTDAVHSIGLGSVPVVYGPTTPPLNVGTYTVDASYGGAAKYFAAAAPQKTFRITPATPSVALTCTPSQDHTGSDLNPCTAEATGVGGDGVLAPPPVVTYTPAPPNGVGHYTANASFAATPNYFAASSEPKTFKIMGTPVVAISCPPTVTYSGSTIMPCTAPVIGQGGGVVGSATISYGGTPVDAGAYTVNATFAGNDLYHPAVALAASFVIVKAPTTTVVSCPASVPHSGSPLTPCTAAVSGAGGLNQAVTPVNYSNNVNPGAATATAAYPGAANYLMSNGVGGFTINPPPDVNWTATGPGTVTLLNNGTGGGMPSMSYSLPTSAGYSTQTFTFSTTASNSGTFKLAYNYHGLHSWFQVRVFLKPFVVSGAGKTYLPGAVSQGPEDCCTAPSNGFSITGSTTFTVNAGDTYGWEIGGSHFDGSQILMGTLAVSSAPLYVNLGYIAGHNCWHNVNVSVVNPTTLRWSNSCAPAVSWLMHATANPNFYTSGPDYPYYNTAADVGFTLTFGMGGVINTITGPSGELYSRVP